MISICVFFLVRNSLFFNFLHYPISKIKVNQKHVDLKKLKSKMRFESPFSQIYYSDPKKTPIFIIVKVNSIVLKIISIQFALKKLMYLTYLLLKCF